MCSEAVVDLAASKDVAIVLPKIAFNCHWAATAFLWHSNLLNICKTLHRLNDVIVVVVANNTGARIVAH